jgi:hypothetical protein
MTEAMKPETKLDDVKMSVRAANILWSMGGGLASLKLVTISDLAALDYRKVERTRGVGRLVLKELEFIVWSAGLTFRNAPEDITAKRLHIALAGLVRKHGASSVMDALVKVVAETK